MVCRDCGKESADEFSFCPYCGKAIAASLPATEPPGSSAPLNPLPEVEAKNPAADRAMDRTNSARMFLGRFLQSLYLYPS